MKPLLHLQINYAYLRHIRKRSQHTCQHLPLRRLTYHAPIPRTITTLYPARSFALGPHQPPQQQAAFHHQTSNPHSQRNIIIMRANLAAHQRACARQYHYRLMVHRNLAKTGLIRHRRTLNQLPVNGQRTRSNARTARIHNGRP